MSQLNYEPNYEQIQGLIRHLDSDSLKDLINNDESVDDLVKNLQQCKDVETQKEMLMAQNKSLAEFNLSMSPKLEQGKIRLKELRDSIEGLCSGVQEKQANHTGNVSNDTALALLQAATAESEEESESIADRFYHKDIDIEEFLEQFTAARERMHLRRVKTDKLTEIMSKMKVTKKAAPSIPYPTGPVMMPQLPMFK